MQNLVGATMIPGTRNTGMPSNPGTISKTLNQSLQEALMDISFDDTFMGPVSQQREMLMGSLPSLNYKCLSTTKPLFMPDIAGVRPNAVQDFGLMTPSDLSKAASRNRLAFSSAIANTPFPSIISRPSAALGLTSDELLLAAAAETRMLDQARNMAAMRRRQTLLEQHKTNESSLLGLLQRGLGYSCTARNTNESQTMKSSLMQQIKQPSLMKQQSTSPEQVEQNVKKSKETLQILGNSLRKKDSPYLDVSQLTDPDPKDTSVKQTRGGVTEPFPEKLHRMLQEVEKAGGENIISFFQHGRAFIVHDPDRFVSEIMPRYFKQSRLTSFQRQLNLYGFTRITSGPDSGGYYHELFLKGRPALSLHMRRVGIPKGADRRKLRAANVCKAPNFYTMNIVSSTQP